MEKNQPYKQDKVFDNILETEEFNVYTKIDDLPLDENPMYLEEGINGICTGGSALFNVFGNKRRIVSNDLVVIFPFQLASVTEISSDFSMTFLKVPKSLFMDTISGICIPTLDFFFYMRKNFRYHLTDSETQRFLSYCRVLNYRSRSEDPAFRNETILHLLQIYFWDYYVSFLKKANSEKVPLTSSNKENIAFKFAMLVAENYRSNREIAFYAAQLCISPAYLTKVIQEMNGQSPHELIADYVIIEIKKLLRDPHIDIKNVAQQTNFASQSSLSRFFRQQTGMSPSEYRRTIHATR